MGTVPSLGSLASRAGHRNAGPSTPSLPLGRVRVATVVHIAVGLLIVANLGRVPVMGVGAKDAPIFLNDLLVGAVVLAGLLACLRARTVKLDSVAGAALTFAAVGALSAVLAVPRFELTGFEFFFSIAYLLRWLVYFAVYVVIINCLRPTDAFPVWRTLQAMVLVFAVFGIFQSIFLPGFAQIVYPDSVVNVDWDYQGHRLVSTFLDPNFAGMLILVPLLVLVATLAFGGRVPQWKLLVLLAALAMTVSRSSILALVAGLAVILVVRGVTRRVLQLGAVVTLVALPFLPLLIDFAVGFNRFAIDYSAMTRVIAWLRAAEIFADNFVIGVGFNTYGFAQRAYGYEVGGKSSFALDGGLIFIAVLTGLVGLAIFCAMLAAALRRCRAVYLEKERTAEERGLALGTAAVTVALVVHSLFLNSLLYPFLTQVLWVLWGLVFLVQRRGVDAPERPERSRAAGSTAPPALVRL
jgi:hypothetical protein